MSTAVSCDDGIDFNTLPVDVREKLAELDLELSEGESNFTQIPFFPSPYNAVTKSCVSPSKHESSKGCL